MEHTVENSKPSPELPPVANCPAWFEKLPLARWGWRELNLFGWPLLIATIGLLWSCSPWSWLAIVPAALLAQLFFFFRDPPRQVPNCPGAIVSPADGKIVEITPLESYDYLGEPAVRIGIFLSIFNVHINRAPLAARVVEMHYKPGEFLNAMNPESAIRNEFMWIGFESTEESRRKLAVRQISGLIARRIVCPLQPGQAVAQGEKFGMIKFGSRTELILPAADLQINARVGDHVRAGSDIIARWM